jgi:hypothetical protein
LQFNSGNIDTVKNIPPNGSVQRPLFTNNTTTILQAAANTTSSQLKFVINSDYNPTTDEFRIDNGSTLYLSGSVYPFTIAFSTPIYNAISNATVIIAGRLETVGQTNISTGNTNVNSIYFVAEKVWCEVFASLHQYNRP